MSYTITYTKIPSEERWLILINNTFTDIMINKCSLGKVIIHLQDSNIILEDTVDSDKIKVKYNSFENKYFGVWDRR